MQNIQTSKNDINDDEQDNLSKNLEALIITIVESAPLKDCTFIASPNLFWFKIACSCSSLSSLYGSLLSFLILYKVLAEEPVNKGLS